MGSSSLMTVFWNREQKEQKDGIATYKAYKPTFREIGH
jgi:hypothetical protein